MRLGTEKRYMAQAPSVPILCASLLSQMRHNRRMAEFAFDRDAVRAAIKASGFSQEEFAAEVGLPHRSALLKILSGERRVKVEEAGRIYQKLRLVPIDHEATRTVPIIGFASAGKWREAVEVPIGRMTLPAHVAGAKAFAVEVKGDSMNKLVEDGGWIVVDPDDKVLAAGKSYLLQNSDFEVTVKQYQKGPPRFEPVSDNADHKCFLASDHDFVVLGRVVWKGSPL